MGSIKRGRFFSPVSWTGQGCSTRLSCLRAIPRAPSPELNPIAYLPDQRRDYDAGGSKDGVVLTYDGMAPLICWLPMWVLTNFYVSFYLLRS